MMVPFVLIVTCVSLVFTFRVNCIYIVRHILESSRLPSSSLIIIIIALVITFMRSIYNYIPETNHVYRLYIVAAVLYLLSVLHVMLFRP